MQYPCDLDQKAQKLSELLQLSILALVFDLNSSVVIDRSPGKERAQQQPKICRIK